MKKIIAFLPVKGTSSRVESKNIKLLDGKPLFLHTLEKLIECKILNIIDEIYLDTESEEVIKLADHLSNYKVMIRDKGLANNKTDGNKLFMNEYKEFNNSVGSADIFIQILCTSPFISIDTIKNGIEIVSNTNQYDSAILVNKSKKYEWDIDGTPKYNVNNIPNSVDLPDQIEESMGLYIISNDAVINTNRRIGNNPFFLPSTPIESIDINYPEDFELASLIEMGKREKDRKLFNNIKNNINSPMISDIMDDLGLPSSVISGLNLNLKNKKIIGRAKTLKLRKLNGNERFEGIYKALESYDTIIPNDIIVVENEVDEYAYFGDLNANLAIRSGAVGAIIGGKTRDSEKVMSMDFPVFSKGYNCKDVRTRATLESINKTIKINGITVRYNDLIFGDNDGIIVIPKEHEKEILDLALETMDNESSILSKVTKGLSVKDIISENGLF